MSKFIQNYQLGEQLGQNNLSTSYLAIDTKTGATCIAKVFSLSQFEAIPPLRQRLLQEVQFLQEHPQTEGLLRYLDMFQSGTNYYLIVSGCKQWTLYSQVINSYRLEELHAVHLLRQIVATYSVYRDAKMPPRDIKPDNILVDEGRVFIDDFGFEKFLLFEVNTQKKLTQSQCDDHIAQEVRIDTRNYDTQRSDSWSLGTTLYWVLFGSYPYHSHQGNAGGQHQPSQIGLPLVIPRQVNDVSPEMEDLLRKILEKNVHQRIAWEEIASHPVFGKYNHLRNQIVYQQQQQNMSVGHRLTKYPQLQQDDAVFQGNFLDDIYGKRQYFSSDFNNPLPNYQKQRALAEVDDSDFLYQKVGGSVPTPQQKQKRLAFASEIEIDDNEIHNREQQVLLQQMLDKYRGKTQNLQQKSNIIGAQNVTKNDSLLYPTFKDNAASNTQQSTVYPVWSQDSSQKNQLDILKNNLNQMTQSLQQSQISKNQTAVYAPPTVQQDQAFYFNPPLIKRIDSLDNSQYQAKIQTNNLSTQSYYKFPDDLREEDEDGDSNTKVQANGGQQQQQQQQQFPSKLDIYTFESDFQSQPKQNTEQQQSMLKSKLGPYDTSRFQAKPQVSAQPQPAFVNPYQTTHQQAPTAFQYNDPKNINTANTYTQQKLDNPSNNQQQNKNIQDQQQKIPQVIPIQQQKIQTTKNATIQPQQQQFNQAAAFQQMSTNLPAHPVVANIKNVQNNNQDNRVLQTQQPQAPPNIQPVNTYQNPVRNVQAQIPQQYTGTVQQKIAVNEQTQTKNIYQNLTVGTFQDQQNNQKSTQQQQNTIVPKTQNSVPQQQIPQINRGVEVQKTIPTQITQQNNVKTPLIQNTQVAMTASGIPNEPIAQKPADVKNLPQRNINSQYMREMQQNFDASDEKLGQQFGSQSDEYPSIFNDREDAIATIGQVLQKYDIMGEAITVLKYHYRADSNFWIVSCFFLLKQLYIQRSKIESALQRGKNVFCIKNWQHFLQSIQYKVLLEAICEKNAKIYAYLDKLIDKVHARLKRVIAESEGSNELEPIKQQINLDLDSATVEEFKKHFFLYIYQHFEGMGTKEDNLKNHLESAYFQYKEYKEVQLTADAAKVLRYIEEKLELAEPLREIVKEKLRSK